jgi:ATP/maltotriose-dependent transcriptional regulator MalT
MDPSREMEVLRLERALQHRDHGDAVPVGTTVKTHLVHIFTKLNIRDRAQAVVATYESDR